LKWAGGKRWLVPYMRPYWESHRHVRYVEPFCGGLAMALGLMPEFALLNDVNTHVINFYKWLQRGLEINIPMENNETLYYQHRHRFNMLISNGEEHSREAAELFYYLNRTGFNGLCRFNRKGEFNVPFGRYKTINYERNFLLYQPILQNWQFSSGDFAAIPLQKGDFVYADPPYDVEFVSYSKEGFTWDDQVRLAKWLSQHDGQVVISNQKTGRIVELYESYSFFVTEVKAPRRISSNGDRTPADEVLAFKFRPEGK
jgi:DNA adenine methylase